MIIDLQRFIEHEQPLWRELEQLLNRIESAPNQRMPLEELQKFHYLFERTAADLAKITTFSAEPETRRYLESLVARAYGEIHETRGKQTKFSPLKWLLKTWPQTFRRHIGAFWLALAVTIAGCAFGGLAILLDPAAKQDLIPGQFSYLQGDPAQRVAREESAQRDRMAGVKERFAAQLMHNNIRVSILVLALGMSWGIGTILELFYNGIILGVVAVDYIRAGQTKFLLGWLLPHGVIEIPAILIAGQAGLMLAGALIGRGNRDPLRLRLRKISADVVTLIFASAVMLVWAGFIESFLSQYHEPVIPYTAKICFGLIELTVLCLFLSRSGRKTAGTGDEEGEGAGQTPIAQAERI